MLTICSLRNYGGQRSIFWNRNKNTNSFFVYILNIHMHYVSVGLKELLFNKQRGVYLSCALVSYLNG
jgi:hypothetical protein